MKTDINQIIEKTTEKTDHHRKTIGIDITIDEIILQTLQTLATEETDKIQEHINKHGSTGYTVMGKLDLLENLQEEVDNYEPG